jgi:hypothetical protein
MPFQRWVFACCITLLGLAAYGQEKPKKAINNFKGPELRLRTNILSFIEPDGHITLGAEWRKWKNFSVGLDLSYIFFSLYNDSRDKPFSGFRIRPEIRHYFALNPKTDWFVTLEGSYKEVRSDDWEEVCISRNPAAVICDYFQRVDYKRVKKHAGASVKLGMVQFISSQRRLYIEAFLGLGIKFTRIKKQNYIAPDNSNQAITVRRDVIFFQTEGTTPNLPAGIKIGWRL